MKNNVYKIIIVIFISFISFLGYSLYKKNISSKTIKETLDYSPKQINTKKVDEKLGNLNQELEKTEKMLQEFHKTTASKKVKLTQKEEVNIKKLQLQIEQVKKTINNISIKTN